LTNWKQAAMGWDSSAAINYNGQLYTWGRGTGQSDFAGTTGSLGTFNANYSSPIQVGSLTNWKEISIGYYWMAALKQDGTLWVWGQNVLGQFGTNTNKNYYSSPVQVGSLTNWKKVYAGRNSLYSIKTDGTLWVCGNNGSGQLGLGNTAYYSSPVQVGALTNWADIGTNGGALHTLGVRTDGTLWAWGDNTSGQLGNGNRTSYSSPVQIGSLTNWKRVFTGWNSSIAIKTDGTLWTWGINDYGELGVGNRTSYSSPVQVGSLTNWKYAIMDNESISALTFTDLN